MVVMSRGKRSIDDNSRPGESEVGSRIDPFLDLEEKNLSSLLSVLCQDPRNLKKYRGICRFLQIW